MKHPMRVGIAAVFCAVVIAPAVAQPFPSFLEHGFRSRTTPNLQVALFWTRQHSGGVAKSINVKSVTQPAKGIYCVHTTITLNASSSYPIATVEYLGSDPNGPLGAIVENSPTLDCGSKDPNTIAVRTYDYSTGHSVLSNNVAFYLVVP